MVNNKTTLSLTAVRPDMAIHTHSCFDSVRYTAVYSSFCFIRCMHNADPLKWDDGIAEVAKVRAEPRLIDMLCDVTCILSALFCTAAVAVEDTAQQCYQ